jgi:Holliday junction resolvase
VVNKSKAKGNRFERQIVDLAKSKGFESKRAWGSNGAALGEHPEVDLLINNFKVQAKCRKQLPDYIKPSNHVDWQVIKEDRGEIYAVIPLNQLLDSLKP